MRKAVLFLLAAVLTSSVASAAGSIYVTMVTASGKTIGAGKMPVIAYRFDPALQTGTKGGDSKQASSLVLTMKIDKSSQALHDAAVTGELISTVVVEVDKPMGAGKKDAFLTITLKRCRVTGVTMTGGASTPTETVTVIYSEMATKVGSPI
jgi:type VI protein secretion system component Hcp